MIGIKLDIFGFDFATLWDMTDCVHPIEMKPEAGDNIWMRNSIYGNSTLFGVLFSFIKLMERKVLVWVK